jgi:nitrogen regulatory protein PII
MKRIEIIANRSIEEDMFEAFEKAGVAQHYTKIPEVMGVGNSGPRMGDHIWPEENFILIVYCEDDEAEGIKRVTGELKEFFVNEGIKLFEIPV